jgi:CheY-like chemotaxis protein
VDRILSFSRIGLGERVPVNVQSVVEETLELLSGSLPAGIRLERHLNASNAAVIGDATHLHQVMMNLCSNAIRAMEPAGGVLGVTLERLELAQSRKLARGSLSAEVYVHLAVSDTGVGIAPQVLERMFDPFFTTRGVGQGTGLGLSLVHGIVSDLGGAIDVATKVGEGTRFEIWLPVTGEVARQTPAIASELPLGAGETVLIVDDEESLVELTEEVLAELGYEPVGYRSSTAALKAFRSDPERYRVVLTDESMPDITGTELARELRRLRPEIPIILTSGHGDAALVRRAAASGINEVLRKPLRRRELAESLARALAPESRRADP